MGICLAADQRLLPGNNDSNDSNGDVNVNINVNAPSVGGVPEVLIVDNVRHVAPYFVHREVSVGRLAVGMSLGSALGVLPGDFGSCDNTALRDWWPRELVAGRLRVTNPNPNSDGSEPTTKTKTATPGCIVRDGDVLTGRYHFHEQSIADRPRPTVVYRDERAGYAALNKPGGIDVLSNPDAHRVLQSLPGLVWSCGLVPPAVVPVPAHRIDHPVSGLVCCGLTPSDAKRLSQRIRARETTKTYLARVVCNRNRNRGALDGSGLPRDIAVPLGFDRSTSMAVAVTMDDVEDETVGEDEGSPPGNNRNISAKPARTTILEVLVPDLGDGTAVIAVRPNTGRKHQIRKHLQHAGIPIANDDRYGGDSSSSSSSSYDGTTLRSVYGLPNPPPALVRFFHDRTAEGCRHCSYLNSLLLGEEPSHHGNEGRRRRSGTTEGPVLSRPIWLHSWRYEFPSLDLSFEAPPPDWAHVELWSHTGTEQLTEP
eukprot:jgi/Psemu1/207778/e_gw1.447.8.1